MRKLTELGGGLEEREGNSVSGSNTQTLQREWPDEETTNSASAEHLRFASTAPTSSSCFEAISVTGSSGKKSFPSVPDWRTPVLHAVF